MATPDIHRPDQDDTAELARILYDAFYDIATSHGFPPDFPNIDFCKAIISLLMSNEGVYSAAAYHNGRPRGSNFTNMWGDVAGIGPISVDLDAQGEGIGKSLMLDALRESKDSGYERVRLMQDSFNMRSLALYASLGFVIKEPVAYMALSDKNAVDDNFRPATPADFDAMDALCTEIYGISRKGEYTSLLAAGFPAYVIDRRHVSAYLIGSSIGHGVAESVEDMLALYNGIGATTPGSLSNCCLRQGDLYRAALASGHKNQKVMNLMAYGPYEDPTGTWTPSVMF
jgi:ribosomal protein S18 acetylase RimI-like enzyme